MGTSDVNAGAQATSLIHPLWFCLWKDLDRVVYCSLVITLSIVPPTALPREQGHAFLAHPRLLLCGAELVFKQTIARQEFPSIIFLNLSSFLGISKGKALG